MLESLMLLGAISSASPASASEIAHRLQRLRTPLRVLHVAAHPDDENTQLLTWLSRGRHVRAAYLSLTRGDGGQNRIGPEQRPLLGLIRTHELMAARQLDGAEQWFTRLRDFGYSKSSEETLRVWGDEAALAEVVRVFRSFRPHVVITRFPESGPTHGHHLASAQLARRAFEAAGARDRYPEQIAAGLKTWRPLRLFYNFPHFWASRGKEPPPGPRFDVDIGGYDSWEGLSYGEISAHSRSMHKSQGFGASARTGPWKETLILLAGEVSASEDPLAGLPTWADVNGADRFADAVETALRAMNGSQPGKLLPWLGRAHKAAAEIDDPDLRAELQSEVERLLVDAAGLLLEARAEVSEVEPGASLSIELRALARTETMGVVLRRVVGPGFELPPREVLQTHELWTKKVGVTVPAGLSPTRPHWLWETPDDARYPVDDLIDAWKPTAPSPLRVQFELGVGGVGITVERSIRRHWVDPVQGERTEPLEVSPRLTVTPQIGVLMVPAQEALPLSVDLRAGPEGFKGVLRWDGEVEVKPRERSVVLGAGESETASFEVRAPAAQARPQESVLTARIHASGRGEEPAWSRWVVDYPHLPRLTHREPTLVRVVPLEFTRPSGVIGYIPGSGDQVAEILRRVGLEVETIDAQILRSLDDQHAINQRYRAILVGIRAFNVNPDVSAAREALMSYVKKGGTLVVQYNSKNWSSKLDVEIGPYPIEIARDRVTDQTAEVRRLNPNHPLLRFPHAIGTRDFEGWIQERGLYFAGTWSKEYEALFSLNDPGAEPLKGSTLYARYGKGHYVYTGLSFFRQLPAGVPGALRLLVNFLSIGEGRVAK